MFSLYELMVLAVMAVALLYFIAWIAAFVDIMKNRFQDGEKLCWLVALIFAPVVGLICYLNFGRKQKSIPD